MNKRISELFDYGDEIVVDERIGGSFDPREIEELTMKKIHAEAAPAPGTRRRLRGGVIAVITVDGKEVDRIDLSRVKEPYDFDLTTEYGHNTIHVEPGAISVTEADCPDLICVYMGKLSGDGIPIICMPHHLMIAVEDSGIDG